MFTLFVLSHPTSTLPAVTDLASAPTTDDFEQHRVELTGYCYRMLGSSFEADDAVQETMVRAWKAADRFEGRSSLRSWLYRIATNVCLTMLDGAQRRARPMDLGPSSTAETSIGPKRPELPWLEPIPDARAIPTSADPAETAALRETIRLAFVVALQHLPARQRAVLIMCEVLHWKADECAQLLETSVASVNSALQRARATLAERQDTTFDAVKPVDEEQDKIVHKYAEFFERYDMDALVTLLHEDVVMSMPPYELWLEGPLNVQNWMLGQGSGCRGSRVVPVVANGTPAFAQYRPDPKGGFEPWALVLIDVSDGQVTAITSFLDTPHLFPIFDLPDHLDN